MRARTGEARRPEDRFRRGLWFTAQHPPVEGVWLYFLNQDPHDAAAHCIGWFGSHKAAQWYVEMEFGC